MPAKKNGTVCGTVLTEILSEGSLGIWHRPSRCHNRSSNNKWLQYSGLPKVRSKEGRAPKGKSIQELPQTPANLRGIVHLKGIGGSKRSKWYGALIQGRKSRPKTRVQGRSSSRHLNPVNKRVSEQISRHQRDPALTRAGKWAGAHCGEQSFFQASVKFQRPFKAPIFRYRTWFWEWEGVRQGSEATLWMREAPCKRKWAVTISGDSYFTCHLNIGPGSQWQCVGGLDLEPECRGIKKNYLFPKRKIKLQTISSLAHHIENEIWREPFLLQHFTASFQNQWENLQFRSSQGDCWQTCTDSSKQVPKAASKPCKPG